MALVNELIYGVRSIPSGSKIWNKTKENKEIKIVEIIFTIKSLKEVLDNLNWLKNSIGKNNKKIEIEEIITAQNAACPDQDVIILSV